MHTLFAVTFPDMGRGLLAVVVFGVALLAGLAGFALLYSVVQLWLARRVMVRKQRSRTSVAAPRASVRALRGETVSRRALNARAAAGLRGRRPLEEIG